MDRRTALRSGLSAGALLLIKDKAPEDLSRGRLPYGVMKADEWAAFVDKVTIDGEHVYGVYECNEEEGYIKYWPDREGKLVTNGDGPYELDISNPQIRHGRVVVTMRTV